MTKDVVDLSLWCDADMFRPALEHSVRWLDWDRDFEIAAATWPPGSLTPEEWLGARNRGFEYCAVVEDHALVSRAAVWDRTRWRAEVAAVWTRDDRRGRGMAKSVVSFVTQHILSAGLIATLHTQPTNAAMLGAATSLGFEMAEWDELVRRHRDV